MSAGKQAERPRIVYVKKKGHAAHHGGAWKVAYADFVTAMMALFMVLWLVSQTDSETKQELSAFFRTGVFSGAPALVMGGSGVSEKAHLDTAGQGVAKTERVGFELASKNVKGVVRSMTPSLQAIVDNIRVEVTKDGLLIQILDGGKGTLFDLSSSDLKPALVELLKELAPILGQLPNKLQIHGHTDSRRFSSRSGRDNWQLSFERAYRARQVLEAAGIPSTQLVGVFAHADSDPINPKDRFAAENRRLSILAVMEGQEDTAQRGFDPLNPDATTPAGKSSGEIKAYEPPSAEPKGTGQAPDTGTEPEGETKPEAPSRGEN
ncbi:MAG: flagellar motor protein MotB [Polyangiaceae bacterium]|nr:flagellar motor protein MotB [Polyangiaceae bacterium]